MALAEFSAKFGTFIESQGSPSEDAIFLAEESRGFLLPEISPWLDLGNGAESVFSLYEIP